MPQSSSQFSGLLGGPIEAAFGSDKPPRPIYRDEAIRNLERNLTGDITSAASHLPAYLKNYRQALAANNPFLRQATLESNDALRNILQRQSTPMDEYRGLGDYLFSKVQAVPDSVLNYLSNGMNISNLARGLGTGADSSYRQILNGRLAQNAALEANRAALGGLVSSFPNLQSAIQARDQTIANILPLRRAGFEALESRALLPYMANLAGLGNLQQLASGQNALDLGNLQGYQPVKNWANRVGDVGRSIGTNISQIMDWAGQAANIVGSLYGGGGLGGMLGGLGGGGGTPATNAYGPAMNAYGANALGGSYSSVPRGSYLGDVNSGFIPYV